jgi:uncharacterized protein YegL
MSADLKIYLVIDGSGSMAGQKHDVVDGLNEFVKEQKADLAPGEDVRFSLTSFDTKVQQPYISEDLSLVGTITIKDTYLGGGTALLDALGKTLTEAEDDAGLRNIVVVYTDGEENSSREFTAKQIQDLVERLEQTGNWQFVYLGAELANFQAQAAGTGIRSAGQTVNTSKSSIGGTFAGMSATTSYYKDADSSVIADISAKGGLIASTAAAGAVDWDAVQDATTKLAEASVKKYEADDTPDE